MALQRRSNDRKQCSIHTDLLNTRMIRIETGIVLKTLLSQPCTDWTGCDARQQR